MEKKKKSTKEHIRIGETRTMSNGKEATIIAYRGANDIDIQFEDGTIRKGVRYQHYKDGKVKDSENSLRQERLNQPYIMSNEKEVTIVRYRNCMDIDIQFDDGTIVTTQYNALINRLVHKEKKTYGNADTREGEKGIAANGEKITIVKYRNRNDMDVKFEDETELEHVSYKKFKERKLTHPNDPKLPKATSLISQRLGETNRNNAGKLMTIVGYRNSVDMDVQFEDQTIRKKVQYRAFLRGEVKHPKDSNRIKKTDNTTTNS